MALYEVRCTNCGATDIQVKPMPPAGGLPDLDCCVFCFNPVQKKYSPPADHSANTFRPRWSDNLSTDGKPVYVGTKDQYNHLKSKLGLTEHEPGMSQDKRRNDAHQAQKAQDAAFSKMFGELKP